MVCYGARSGIVHLPTFGAAYAVVEQLEKLRKLDDWVKM
jgi:hypothetical protein